MKKEAIALMLLLALAMMPMLTTNTSAHLIGSQYPTMSNISSGVPGWLDWYAPNGYGTAMNLSWAPSFIQLETQAKVETDTTVILQGNDTYGQNVEAKVFIPGGTGPEQYFIFNDSVTQAMEPVAFAKITNIFQQNGTHNDQFWILTTPTQAYQGVPFPLYLGEDHASAGIPGWSPGTYSWNGLPLYSGKYLVGHGPSTTLTKQNVAVEPKTPEPLRVYINWHESDGDLYPEDYVHGAYQSEFPTGGSTAPAWLYIEGLDQTGNKIWTNITIPSGVEYVDIPSTVTSDPSGACHTWSCVCDVETNGSNSYYLFAMAEPIQTLFTYSILIDHMDIYLNSYDLLADPLNIGGLYPGVTNVTVLLVDQDGNVVNANPFEPVEVNFAATDGWVEPSYDNWILGNMSTFTANLTADTQAKTLNVTASAIVPACYFGKTATNPGTLISPKLNLFAWTEATYDGINSVFSLEGQTWPIHEMYWGYHTWTDPATGGSGWLTAYTAPLPPEPPLPTYLGGPDPATAPYSFKFNGPLYEVMIPLYVGCNLISCPVEPMMNKDPNLPLSANQYYSASEPQAGGTGIPMSLLFGATDSENVEIIWWYCGGSWNWYIPSTNTNGGTGAPVFTDGVGYWIMCDKPCTLEISGFNMQNAPFIPPGGNMVVPYYTLPPHAWSLVGVTSITGFANYGDYLESTWAGDTQSPTVGPIWVYYAQKSAWFRNPAWGLWPTQAFWVYNSMPVAQYIAP